MRRTDILNLSYRGGAHRSSEAEVLIANYLKMHGLTVVHGSIHNGFELLLRFRPKVLLFSDAIGARINTLIAKFAKSLGIKVVSSIGEGIIGKNAAPESYWGWNSEHEPCEDLLLHWSETALKQFCEYIPEHAPFSVVCGATGADRYLFAKPITQLPVERTRYALIVGVGCYAFDLLIGKSSTPLATDFSQVTKAFFTHERECFATELAKIVQNNPDVLFLLKEHPASASNEDSAIEKCINFNNALILKDEPIFDCIYHSDIWLSYESTTALEAWLMGKPTALLNPSGTDFPIERMSITDGQPNYTSAKEWINAIEYFKKHNVLLGFSERTKQREAIIRRYFQWNDGLNHVRAGNAILDLMERPSTLVVPWHWKQFTKHILNHTFRWHFSPYHRFFPSRPDWFAALRPFYEEYRSNWLQEVNEKFSSSRMKEQQAYYASKNLTLSDLRAMFYGKNIEN